MKRTKGYIAAILSAMAYGSGPLIVMLVYDRGFGVNSVSFFRVLFPVPVLALLVLLKKGDSLRITGRQALQILALAVTGSVLTSLLLFASIRYIDTGIAPGANFGFSIAFSVAVRPTATSALFGARPNSNVNANSYCAKPYTGRR